MGFLATDFKVCDMRFSANALLEATLTSTQDSHAPRSVLANNRHLDQPQSGGSNLDLDNGKTYTLRQRVADDNRSLLVRGDIGPFFRTQTWHQAQR